MALWHVAEPLMCKSRWSERQQPHTVVAGGSRGRHARTRRVGRRGYLLSVPEGRGWRFAAGCGGNIFSASSAANLGLQLQVYSVERSFRCSPLPHCSLLCGMSTALSESLWEKVDVLRDSGQHGAKSCIGMANFLSERAAIETTYGNVRKYSSSPSAL